MTNRKRKRKDRMILEDRFKKMMKLSSSYESFMFSAEERRHIVFYDFSKHPNLDYPRLSGYAELSMQLWATNGVDAWPDSSDVEPVPSCWEIGLV